MMEEKVFRRPAVAGVLESFIEARLHSDHPDASKRKPNVDLQKRLTSSVANPVYVTVNPVTGVKLAIQMGATSDETFIEYLQTSLRTRDQSGVNELQVASAKEAATSGGE